jgi:carbonic anhydrase
MNAWPEHSIGGAIDLASVLPDDQSSYNYEGSRTSPPCSEGVRWFVMKELIELSAQQIAAFRAVFDFNARPIQSQNDRDVLEVQIEGLQAESV